MPFSANEGAKVGKVAGSTGRALKIRGDRLAVGAWEL